MREWKELQMKLTKTAAAEAAGDSEPAVLSRFPWVPPCVCRVVCFLPAGGFENKYETDFADWSPDRVQLVVQTKVPLSDALYPC